MFTKNSSGDFRTLLPGIQFKTPVWGEKTSLSVFHLAKDSLIPPHAHPHEQTGYLVSGHLRFTIGPESMDALPGDSWCLPGGVEHAVEIIEDSIVIEVFSPIREDYLPVK